MIGGRFNFASVASIAAAGLFMGGVAAKAADLGGNCCADLEERVAELEATTARKGNRKVSLEVSGHVHEAIVFYDVRTDNGVNEESNIHIGTHGASESRFRFRGSAKIDADWSAGFLMEFGVSANNLGDIDQDRGNSPRLRIRHEALYLKSNTMGTLWLGQTSSAADGITEICLGCGIHNSTDYSDDLGDMLAGNGETFASFGGPQGVFAGEGDRREVIRYISPTLAGFVISAAYGQDDFYDVALRYAGEFGQIRIAGGIGYQRDTSGDTGGGTAAGSCLAGPGLSTYDCALIGASLSMQHTPTGLYVAGAYGQHENELAGSGADKGMGYRVTGGVYSKWISLGKTNIWGEYGYNENDVQDSELVVYGVGIQQNIDAASMSIFLHWKRFEADATGAGTFGATSSEMDQIVAGGLIRF